LTSDHESNRKLDDKQSMMPQRNSTMNCCVKSSSVDSLDDPLFTVSLLYFGSRRMAGRSGVFGKGGVFDSSNRLYLGEGWVVVEEPVRFLAVF